MFVDMNVVVSMIQFQLWLNLFIFEESLEIVGNSASFKQYNNNNNRKIIYNQLVMIVNDGGDGDNRITIFFALVLTEQGEHQ